METIFYGAAISLGIYGSIIKVLLGLFSFVCIFFIICHECESIYCSSANYFLKFLILGLTYIGIEKVIVAWYVWNGWG
ncbi:MAG: hypothetical protein DSZ28_09670 [Thiothrix sp.]|nr:MAG: hypothetical protein DSZ28_09670 [Thiothrix sp.]